jgi:hypothetical protein
MVIAHSRRPRPIPTIRGKVSGYCKPRLGGVAPILGLMYQQVIPDGTYHFAHSKPGYDIA